MIASKRLKQLSSLAPALVYLLVLQGCAKQEEAAQAPPDEMVESLREQAPEVDDGAVVIEQNTEFQVAPFELAEPVQVEPKANSLEQPTLRRVDPAITRGTFAADSLSRNLAPTAEPRIAPAAPIEAQPPQPAIADAAPIALKAQMTPPTAHRVAVFYATDRQSAESALANYRLRAYAPAAGAALATLLFGVATVFLRRRVLWCFLAIASGLGTAQFFHVGHLDAQKTSRLAAEDGHIYSNDRNPSADHPLELGVCHVTIPPSHQVGTIESPSILKLEFAEDSEKHVVLESITHTEVDDFYTDLQAKIDQSKSQQAFVFVHGYNVDFEAAVKRTAQIAHDLRFDGAPICYSWPSKGGLAEYTRDEANVSWTVVHLEQFLNDVATRSNARTVHLVAHSMGNRALVQALERMSLQMKEQGPKFGQVVLAAPDVDASEFKKRYAPAVTQMASQVTLYASSNDRALVASMKVHGHTRAGLSGDSLVVLPGIDTIDVSHIDTSLLGHSYYGNSPQMIQDMQALVELGHPATHRSWLVQVATEPGLAYWVFRNPIESLRSPAERVGAASTGTAVQ